MKPLISVIIPTYNHAAFLKEAIDSVLQQSYDNFELIIINNYSQDNTVDIVNSYTDKRISLVNFKNNGIIAASRNTGLSYSKGEYIAFLDSDDIWLPGKLAEQARYLEKNKGIDLVCTNAVRFNDSLGYKKKIKHMFFNHVISFREQLLGSNIMNSSVLFRNSCVEQIGKIDEDQRIVGVEDYDYWLRVLWNKDNSILMLKDVFLLYREHGKNACSSFFENLNNFNSKVSIVYGKYSASCGASVAKAVRNARRISYKVGLENGVCSLKDFISTNEISLVSKILILFAVIVKRFFLSVGVI